jgi:hypothetical protein
MLDEGGRGHEVCPDCGDLGEAGVGGVRDRVRSEHHPVVSFAGLDDRGPGPGGQVAAGEHQRVHPQAQQQVVEIRTVEGTPTRLEHRVLVGPSSCGLPDSSRSASRAGAPGGPIPSASWLP